MTKVAFIFPGQGTQTVGMAKELYDASPVAKEIIDMADSLLSNGLRDVMFHGPQEKLTQTACSQPAIFSHSIAALNTFQKSDKYKNVEPLFAAGLSLGEYSALCACGALSFEETLKLLKIRSIFMEEATKLQAGRMYAIMGLDKAKITEICAQTGAEVANFNSLQQIVITGHAQKVEAAAQKCQEAGAKNVVRLDVAGGFHSSLMQPAAEKFKGELQKISIAPPQFALVSNVDAQATRDAQTIKANLAKQIISSVQWVATIQNIAAQGVADFIEVGPGKVLKGLIRRIDPNLKVHNIEKPADIDSLPF